LHQQWDSETWTGESYVVFGKANSSAINLSAIADANNPTGGFVINGEVANDRSGCITVGFTKHNIRFTCI
jgi:Neuraminidase (sialidase)